MENWVTFNKQWQTPMTKTKNTNIDFILLAKFFQQLAGFEKNPLQKIQKNKEEM
jgi:hypothetical protein